MLYDVKIIYIKIKIYILYLQKYFFSKNQSYMNKIENSFLELWDGWINKVFGLIKSRHDSNCHRIHVGVYIDMQSMFYYFLTY